MLPMYQETSSALAVFIIPVILYGVYTTRKELKKQNRNREKEREKKAPIDRYRETHQQIYSKPEKGMSSVIPAWRVQQVIPTPTYDICKNWFITDWGKKSIPSLAEQRVINELVKYNIEWHREVSFNGFLTKQNGHYRFDFFLPEYRMCIEYNGADYHREEDRKEVDRIKKEFCHKHKLKLVTLQGKDYYHMPEKIKEVLSQNKKVS